MNRSALLFVVLLATPLANAQISAKLVMEDQRSSERKVYLFSTWSERVGYSSSDWSKDAKLIGLGVYLPADEIGETMNWELIYENAEVLRQAYQIAIHNKNGTKVSVKGREVQTIRGRGFLVESIRSSW